MLNNNPTQLFSNFTSIKIKFSHENIISLEVIDPINNSIVSFPLDKINDLEKIKLFLDNLRSKITSLPPKMHAAYQHWFRHGWHKAFEYHFAIRSEKLPISLNSALAIKIIPKSNRIKATPNNDNIFQNHTRQRFRPKNIESSQFMEAFSQYLTCYASTLATPGIKIYLIAYRITDLDPGIYQYQRGQNNNLKLIKEGLFIHHMMHCSYSLPLIRSASFSLLFIADFYQLMKNMPCASGLRNAYIEAGKLAQLAMLQFAAKQFVSLPNLAIKDSAITHLLSLDNKRYYPLYTVNFGLPYDKK